MKIQEIEKKTGLTADTLRYYEKIGLLPKVERNKSGFREYGETDVSWIEFIKCMRQAGVSIESLIKYVFLFEKGNESISERKNILITERKRINDKIIELNTVLERLDYKIDHYDEINKVQDKLNLKI